MDEQDVVLERLKLLNEYLNDLLELHPVDLQTYTENKLIYRSLAVWPAEGGRCQAGMRLMCEDVRRKA